MKGIMVSVLAAVLVTGCGSLAENDSAPAGGNEGASGKAVASSGASASGVEPIDEAGGEVAAGGERDSGDGPRSTGESRYTLFPGTGVFVEGAGEAGRERPASGDGAVMLNFEGADLREVVRAIVGDILGHNYLITAGVQGSVTFSTERPIARADLMPVLQTLLGLNNATLVEVEGLYKVVPVPQAVRGQLSPRPGAAAGSSGYEVRVVPLRYISVSEMGKLLAPFVREGAILSVDPRRNLMMLGGTPADLDNYLETIDVFDVDWLAGMSVGVFPLSQVDAESIARELQAILGDSADGSGMFRFTPIERLNAILVITPQPDYLEKVKTWIERLDRGVNRAGSRLYVYDVINVKATDLAQTLTETFAGEGDGGRRRGEARVAPGLQPEELVGPAERPDGQEAPPPRPLPRRADSASVKLVDASDVRIIAVEESNSLLIRATPAQYESILAAIKRLDVVPLQVLIEVTILEVTLSKELEFGVRWFIEGSTRGAPESVKLGLPVPGEDDSGFSWNIVNRDLIEATIEGFIRALDKISNVNVVSAPSLVVLNNREASINIGDQIPVVTSSLNPGTDDTINSVQFRDTGVILSVTPRVNPGGLVYLDVSQEVSDPGEVEPETRNRPIRRRTLDTEIAVHSGETVLLGGLIRENRTQGGAGVPLLHRVPLIGYAFGQKSRSLNRTELLLVIKPTVIGGEDRAREVTEEYRRKLEGLEPLRERLEF